MDRHFNQGALAATGYSLLSAVSAPARSHIPRTPTLPVSRRTESGYPKSRRSRGMLTTRIGVSHAVSMPSAQLTESAGVARRAAVRHYQPRGKYKPSWNIRWGISTAQKRGRPGQVARRSTASAIPLQTGQSSPGVKSGRDGWRPCQWSIAMASRLRPAVLIAFFRSPTTDLVPWLAQNSAGARPQITPVRTDNCLRHSQ